MHFLIYVKTYRTLINIQISIKEMVYYIFKGMVSKTNCKNIELDLLKHYTILFTIQHLIDSSINLRFIRSCSGFTNMSLNFKQLFSNWYITENKLLQKKEDQDNVNDKIKIIF